MKKKNLLLTILIAATFLLGGGAELMGQTFQIGTGVHTTTNYPAVTQKAYSVTQQIHHKTEIFKAVNITDESTFNYTQGGTITKLYFYNNENTSKTLNIDLYFALTDKNIFSGASDWISPSSFSKVFSGEITFTNNAWSGITLTTPFLYNGTDNIAIMVVNKNMDSSTALSFYDYRVDYASYRTLYYSSTTSIDLNTLPTATSRTYWFNIIRFDFTPAVESCVKPTNFEYSDVTDSEATLKWDAGDEETEWQIAISSNSTADPETIAETVTSRTKTYDDLEYKTTYYAWVRSYCDDDNQSDWVTTSFTTDCGSRALPYFYGFENEAQFDCWSINNCYSNTKITSSNANTGSYKFTFCYSESHDLQTIITPELNTTTNGIRVEFYFKTQYSSSYGIPKLKIAYSTSSNDLASFDWTNCTEATVSSYYYYNYQYFGLDLPYNGIKYIAIQFDRNSSTNNIYLDDIKFSDIPTVDLPYEYGFETASELNSWIKRDCYSSTGIKDGGHTGSNSFGFIRGNTMETQYLITPMLNGTTNGALISLYFTADANCKFQIGYSTTNDVTSSFTFGDEVTETTASYKYYEYYCPANTKFICIKYVATSTTNYALNIDDIRIVTFDKVSNGSQGYAYWNNDSDWYPVNVPSSTDNVYINHNMTIPNDCTAEANSIILGPSGSLTIADGGQLICNNAVQATVEKNISAWPNTTPADGWYFIASPINRNDLAPTEVNNMITDNIPNDDESTPRTYDLYNYDATANSWINYRGHSNDFVIANGRGYLYANKSDQTLAFAGAIKPYDADYTIPVTAGWNLVGNPYTFNAYANRRYYKINPSSTNIEPVANNEAVPPCTGIIVNTEDNDDPVTFTDTQSGTSYANQGNLQMVLAQNVATRGEGTAQTLDKAIVSFNEGSQLGKFYFGTQDANLYIPQNNEEYAIVSSNAQGEMPVNFKAHRDGQYTITVNPQEVEMGYLHLIDNIGGMDIDLLATPSYTFNAKADDYESRFRLVFVANANEDESQNDFAFISNGSLIVTGEGTLQIFDILGHQLFTKQAPLTSQLSTLTFKAGVYVLRLINGENVKTQKIIVK